MFFSTKIEEDIVAKGRLSMRKIREILRLKHDNGLTDRQIAESCLVSRSTVASYLVRAESAGLAWPIPDGRTLLKLLNQRSEPDVLIQEPHSFFS